MFNRINREFQFSNTKLYLILGFITILEYAIFRTYIVQNVIPFYPPNFDQAAYLTRIYYLYSELTNHQLNFHALFTQANSFLFIPQTILFFIFFGASRLTALSINFLYFLALQIVSFFIARSVTKSTALAFLFVGLILSVNVPFFWAGGIADYRIDFMAFCLYGIFVSSMIRSYTFLDRKWSVVSAGIAVGLILLRFITAVYLAITIGCVLLYFYYLFYVNKKNNIDISSIKIRLKNAFIFSGVVACICGPILLAYQKLIYGYYVIGDILGPEKKIRELVSGVHNLRENILFYPDSVYYSHLGKYTIHLFVFLMVFSLIMFGIKKLKGTSSNFSENRINIIFLVFTIIIPILILTIDEAKSPVVGSIVVVPILWLIFLIAFELNFKNIASKSKIFIPLLASIIFGIGAYNYVYNLVGHSALYNDKSAHQLNKLYMMVGNYVQHNHIQSPIIAESQLNGQVLAAIINDMVFEKTGKYINTVQNPIVGGSIFSMTKAAALKSLSESDFYITIPYFGVYPANYSLTKIDSELLKIAKSQMIYLGGVGYGQNEYQVYAKPEFAIEDKSGNWMASQGVILKVPSKVVPRAKEIVLSGYTSPQFINLLQDLHFQAFVDATKQALPVIYTESQGHYRIEIKMPIAKSKQDLKISLIPSTYFIPEKEGINSDTRKLVLEGPFTKEVIL